MAISIEWDLLPFTDSIKRAQNLGASITVVDIQSGSTARGKDVVVIR